MDVAERYTEDEEGNMAWEEYKKLHTQAKAYKHNNID